MTAIKPCPFCGGTPTNFSTSQGFKWGYVICCGQGPEVRTSYKSEEHWRMDAIEAWNKRQEPEQPTKKPMGHTCLVTEEQLDDMSMRLDLIDASVKDMETSLKGLLYDDIDAIGQRLLDINSRLDDLLLVKG